MGGYLSSTPSKYRDHNEQGLQTDNQYYRILLTEVIILLILTEVFRSKNSRKILHSFHAGSGNYHSRIDLIFESNIAYKNTQEIYYMSVEFFRSRCIHSQDRINMIKRKSSPEMDW